MTHDKSQRAFGLVIVKTAGHEWMLERSREQMIGPYYDARAALQVAAVEILSARQRGVKANLYVQDEYGDVHPCPLIDDPNAERCPRCQNSWAEAATPLPPRCPLWEALGDG